MFVNIPIVKQEVITGSEFVDGDIRNTVRYEDNGVTTLYINTDHIESITAASRTRSELVMMNGSAYLADKSIAEMGNLVQRINIIHGHITIPSEVF